MAYTFGDVIRRVKLRCATVPILLIEDMVQSVLNQLVDQRDWSFLRTETQLVLRAARTGTVAVVQEDRVVQGLSLVFSSADVGRQFRAGAIGQPLTIFSVDTLLNQATLEFPYGGLSLSSVNAIVFDAFVTAPADFHHWLVVTDPPNSRRLRVYVTDESLNRRDPARQTPGDPWSLVAYRYSNLPATQGRVLYEAWPYWFGAAIRYYPAWYIRRPSLLTEDTPLPGPLGDRGEVLIYGALAEVSAWPGEENRPNPTYNLKGAEYYFKLFTQAWMELEVKDENIYSTWLQQQPWYGWDYVRDPEVGPGDAAYIQSHE